MTNNLESVRPVSTSGGVKHRPKGWSPDRRARQAVLIRGWQPWRRSTGPKTEAGKARCAMNALKHGFRSRATIQEFQRVRYAIRLAARNNEILRLFIRMRDGHPDLKPSTRTCCRRRRTVSVNSCETARAGKISKANERTNESRNSPTRPISYERAVEHPNGYRRSRATSHGGLERRSVLWRSNGVGSRGKIA